MIWPFKKVRNLTQQEYHELFIRFMHAPEGGIFEYPEDVNIIQLHVLWLFARERKKQILDDIERCGGTFPNAYDYR